MTQTANRVMLTGAEPQLFVSDVTATCEFFKKKLGFEIAFLYGSPPFYGQARRDAARINLRHVDGPAIDPLLRDREELLSASMTVASVDAIDRLFREFESAGAIFQRRLTRQAWGAVDFIVKDPDGNLLLFAGPAD